MPMATVPAFNERRTLRFGYFNLRRSWRFSTCIKTAELYSVQFTAHHFALELWQPIPHQPPRLLKFTSMQRISRCVCPGFAFAWQPPFCLTSAVTSAYSCARGTTPFQYPSALNTAAALLYPHTTSCTHKLPPCVLSPLSCGVSRMNAVRFKKKPHNTKTNQTLRAGVIPFAPRQL